jgi:hypothetical protein
LTGSRTRSAVFADLLGGDVKDPKVAQKRALIENLLETVKRGRAASLGHRL